MFFDIMYIITFIVELISSGYTLYYFSYILNYILLISISSSDVSLAIEYVIFFTIFLIISILLCIMLNILINYDESLQLDKNIPEIKLPYKIIKKCFLSLYGTSNLIRYNRVVLTIKANGKKYNIGFKSFLDYFQWYFLVSKYMRLDRKRKAVEDKVKEEQEKYDKLKTFSEDIIKEFASEEYPEEEYPEEKNEPLLLSYSDEKSNKNSVGKKLCLILSQTVSSWKESKKSTPPWKSSKSTPPWKSSERSE